MYPDTAATRLFALGAALSLSLGSVGCASDGEARPAPRPPPAFEPPPGPAGAPRVDLRWKAVSTRFRADGAILASVEIRAPSVRVFLPRSPRVQAALAKDVGTRAFSLREVPESLRELWSLDAQLVAVHDGEIYVRDANFPQRVPLWIHDLELSVENVATRRALTGGLPGLLLARAKIWRTGVLTAFVAADPFGTGLNISGQAAIRDLDLREIASFFPETFGLRPTAGTLDVYVVFAAEAGQLRGGAKIIMRDVEVEARGGFWQEAKAATVNVMIDLFSDDRLATIVPIQGTLTDPEVQVWPAVFGVLYNAFVTAFEASYSGIPPRLAPTRQGVGEQAWRILVRGRRPRAQPAPPSEPGDRATPTNGSPE